MTDIMNGHAPSENLVAEELYVPVPEAETVETNVGSSEVEAEYTTAQARRDIATAVYARYGLEHGKPPTSAHAGRMAVDCMAELVTNFNETFPTKSIKYVGKTGINQWLADQMSPQSSEGGEQ